MESDLSTRDPFGGFIIKPMHFLFDFDNFPITDELVTNFRRNEGPLQPVRSNQQLAIRGDRPAPERRRTAVYGKYGGFFNTLTGENWRFGESGRPVTQSTMVHG